MTKLMTDAHVRGTCGEFNAIKACEVCGLWWD